MFFFFAIIKLSFTFIIIIINSALVSCTCKSVCANTACTVFGVQFVRSVSS